MAEAGFSEGSFYDKPKNWWNKFTCYLGFHDWLCCPHFLEASVREVCQKGCRSTKDCFDVIRKW